jgi:hypothetical protein
MTSSANQLPCKARIIPKDRKCVLCKSTDTRGYYKNGKLYHTWLRNESGFICTTCFYKSAKERERLRLYIQNNKSYVNQLRREWYRKDPERTSKIESEKRKKKRQRALFLVGRGQIECINCGCDRPEFLEVNHVNGGGGKENERSSKFYCDILTRRRKIDDLELRCKVCNILHYSERTYGNLPFRIIWDANDGSL